LSVPLLTVAATPDEPLSKTIHPITGLIDEISAGRIHVRHALLPGIQRPRAPLLGAPERGALYVKLTWDLVASAPEVVLQARRSADTAQVAARRRAAARSHSWTMVERYGM
jgi:hypothetical protein